MKRQPSLSTRAFFFAFVPMCLTLVASFFVINKAVEGRIKGRLRLSLQKTERMLAGRDAEYRQHTLSALTTVTENPSLKAVIGLLRESPDPKSQAQVYGILADQLQQMNKLLDYDVLLLEDPTGKPVVGVMGANRVELGQGSESIEFLAASLLRMHTVLYEAIAVPINLNYENLGILILGKKFDISYWKELGYAALLQDGKVIVTTFPGERIEEVERQIQQRCGGGSQECEIAVGEESYLTLAVQRESFGDKVRLFTFQSIDAAMSGFTQSIESVFLWIGAGGVFLIFLFSVFGARSIAKPLTNLIAQLQQSEQVDQLPTDFPTNFQAAEVNVLAKAFSRAAGAVRESKQRLDEATEQFIETMAQTLDARDPYTAGHSDRVSANSTTIAETMGLPPEQIEIIRIGAKLHDIGKIGVPDAVLRKAGPLTREEFALIKLHPQIGKRILEQVERFEEYLPIVELHHENHDGSGYPYGMKGEEIPLGVRIVHVADVYDAITSDRAYRKAMEEERVWEIMVKGAGKEFDPAIVKVFLTILRQQKVLHEALEQVSLANA
ncbi:MAG: HD-GYP domain-containing protein [Acidobacteria bacterium]|nr:HD-GYP domain-containing protein [Acidobacteriota bacterium]